MELNSKRSVLKTELRKTNNMQEGYINYFFPQMLHKLHLKM